MKQHNKILNEVTKIPFKDGSYVKIEEISQGASIFYDIKYFQENIVHFIGRYNELDKYKCSVETNGTHIIIYNWKITEKEQKVVTKVINVYDIDDMVEVLNTELELINLYNNFLDSDKLIPDNNLKSKLNVRIDSERKRSHLNSFKELSSKIKTIFGKNIIEEESNQKRLDKKD